MERTNEMENDERLIANFEATQRAEMPSWVYEQ